MGDMTNNLAQKILNSVPEADHEKVIHLARSMAQRATAIFSEQLAKELEMFSGKLMATAMNAAFQEFNNLTLILGADSQVVTSLNAQLRDQLETVIHQGHRHIWGDPRRGRPPASPHEKHTQAQEKTKEFLRRVFDAIAKVRDTKGEHELRKQANVAREVFPTRKKSRGAETALRESLAMCGVTYDQLLQMEKMLVKKNCYSEKENNY